MGTEQKRGILFSAAPIAPTEPIPYAPQPHDYVVCADGGLGLAKRLGVRPHLIVGDFDSGNDPRETGEPLFDMLQFDLNMVASQILDAGRRSAISGREEQIRTPDWTIG